MEKSASELWLGLALAVLTMGCAHRQPAPTLETEAVPERKLYNLRAERIWQLESEAERFDASGLLWSREGKLLTLNDRNSDLFEIEITGSEALANPTGLFPPYEVAAQAPSEQERFDCEGIAQDEQGRLYVCEEADRAIYRWDGGKHEMKRLAIDWGPVASHFKGGINASFEGIAIGNGRLYVANERSNALIIVVDLATSRIVDHFFVASSGFVLGGPHYSDISWFDGHLYILDRNARTILQVAPESRTVIAEFRFGQMEHLPEVDYRRDFPTGAMEGLAVTGTHFWLVTDNNGRGRVRYPNDIRPTLFRCERPDRN